MTCLRAVIRLERPLADGEHGLLEPRAPPAGMLMRPPVITPGAQRGPAVGRRRLVCSGRRRRFKISAT